MIKKSMIVAAATNGVIGINNKLPWHLPEDLKYFRQVTMGKPIIMGRATFESIGRPLPGRKSIVVTRNTQWNYPGVSVAHSIDDAMKMAEAQAEIDGVDELMVIGGAAIYKEAMPLIDRVYFTQVHADVFGDARFELDDAKVWQEVSRQEFSACEHNPYDYSFIVLERK